MKLRLAALALLALCALIGVSVWATSHQSIGASIADLSAHPGDGQNPWYVATVFDAYFGFLWFWAWIAYKETGVVARALWLVAVLLAGNMAMAIYMLLQLRKLPPGATAQDLLLRRT